MKAEQEIKDELERNKVILEVKEFNLKEGFESNRLAIKLIKRDIALLEWILLPTRIDAKLYSQEKGAYTSETGEESELPPSPKKVN